MTCKVADFGLSRELEEDNPDSEYQTQVSWVGTHPETFLFNSCFSAVCKGNNVFDGCFILLQG